MLGSLWLILGTAVAAPTVWIDGHGGAVDTTGIDVLAVSGTVEGLDPTHVYEVTTGLGPATLALDPNGETGTWVGEIDVKNTPPSPAIQLPVFAELTDLTTGRLWSRDRVVFLDTKGDGGLVPNHPNVTLDEGYAQLSPHGLDQLELVHHDLAAYPDLPTFEGVVAATATESARSYVPTLTCAPVPNTRAWKTALQSVDAVADARDEYLAYVVAQALSNLPPPLNAPFVIQAANSCVKSPPKTLDFEVCVGRVDLRVDDVDIGTVDVPDLSFVTGAGELESVVGVGDVDAQASALLRDLIIRYRRGGPTCYPKPADKYLPDDTVEADAELLAFTTCPGVTITGAAGNGVGAWGFTGTGAQESLLWAPTAPGDIQVSGGTSGLLGSCPEPRFDDVVAEGAGPLADAVGDAITTEWYAGDPDSGEDAGLAALFAPFEPGGAVPVAYDPASAAGPALSSPTSGAALEVTATDAKPVGGAFMPTHFVHRPAIGRPAFAGAIDPYGNPFDVAYSVTVGMLNQNLRAATFHDTQLGRVVLTNGELPAALANGADEDPALFGGDQLQSLVDDKTHPAAYAALDNLRFSQLQVEVDATIQAFTLMMPDPIGGKPGEVPLTYQIPQVELSLVDTLGYVRYRIVYDLVQPDTAVGFAHDGPWLRFGGKKADGWGWVAIGPLAVGKCSRDPLIDRTGCDGELEDALGGLFLPAIRDRVWALLDEIPGPAQFDREGTVGAPEHVSTKATFSADQRVTVFGDL